MSTDDRERIWSMLDDHALCMLVTNTGDSLRARPMMAFPRPDESAIWFLSDADGSKDEEISDDSQVCVTYARPSENDFVSLSGEARVDSERGKIRDLWNSAAQAYFPDGPDSASVQLIRFTPHRGEYWDATGNRALLALRMIQARAQGVRPDVGETGKVDF